MNALFRRLLLLKPYAPHMAAALLAMILGWSVGSTTASNTAAGMNGEENWSLPQWSPYSAAGLRRETASFRVWLGDIRDQQVEAAVEAPRDLSAWNFIGTIARDGVWLAVIHLPGSGKTKLIAAGEELPDGSLARRIGDGELHVTAEGADHSLRLFEDTTEKASLNEPR